MREYEFRGKEIETGEWLYGYYVKEEGNNYIAHENIETHLTDYDLIDINTLGQYIGIKDKHRKKIFEGDIVLIGNTELKICFDNSNLAYVAIRLYGSRCCLGILKDEAIEVLGNIYDNSDSVLVWG